LIANSEVVRNLVMDPLRRKELEKVALERLEASADDEWSYAWTGPGRVNLSFCRWSEHDEFDGTVRGLSLPWTEERLNEIERGADPNETELRQWREAMCRQTADAGEANIVWIAPVPDENPPEAFAMFMWHYGGAAGDPPWFEGVFESIAEAKAHLAAEGVTSDINPGG
jgi:hypothetical protein